MGYKYPRHQRLASAKSFRYVFSAAQKQQSEGIVVFARKNQLTYNRLGLIIRKHEVPLAVKRNNYKRLIRESFRLCQHRVFGIDFIVMVKRQCMQKSNQQLLKSLNTLWLRFGRFLNLSQ